MNEAQDHNKLKQALHWPDATFNQIHDFYNDILHDPGISDIHLATLGRVDRYFLLTHLLKRVDAVHPWLYDRCREVESNPDGYLDLWSREHYKSTIVTFAGSIQEIINDPNITIGIFSHTRPIAKAFLDQIKQELERNETLKRIYKEILYTNPKKTSPTWSLDSGIVVKRQTNPKERTIEAHGLVDGQPVSKHFGLMIFDDVVTQASVTSADMIRKTTEAWELAQHLGSGEFPRKWHIGTRYNLADSYHTIMDRGAVKPRIYPATDDGTPDGKPVFLSQEAWDKKRKESSGYTIACQMLQNPIAGSQQEFQTDWIRTYEVRPHTLNVYMMWDYAGSRKSTGSSKTAVAVIGVDAALNKYLLDGACHKMDLNERWKLMKKLRNKWISAPGVQIVKIGYERYGAQSDIQHFETMMRIEKTAFAIEELNNTRDGTVDKDNRIRRLIPDFQNWRFFLPYEGDKTSLQADAENNHQSHLIAKKIRAVNEDDKVYNVTQWFLENEYVFFPHTTQKDFLDAMSRIYDMEISAPMTYDETDVYPEVV